MIRRENRDTIYYGYDLGDRLTSEEWRASGGGVLYAFQWDYDLVGNRVYESAAGVRGGTVEAPAETYYEHDPANELIRSRQIGGDHPGYTYYAYDSRGNCTAIQEPEGTSYFQHNDADLVESIHYRTGVWNYFYYDAQLRRYAIQESTGLTYLTWDRNAMNLLMERDAQGNVTAEYAHGYTPTDGIGSTIGAKKTISGATHRQYSIYDARGTVFRIVDETGAVTHSYEHNACGELLSKVEGSIPNRFGFQTNWYRLTDAPWDLLASPTRFYAAPLGRFNQRDHMKLEGNYLFAHGAPSMLTDPTGTSAATPPRSSGTGATATASTSRIDPEGLHARPLTPSTVAPPFRMCAQLQTEHYQFEPSSKIAQLTRITVAQFSKTIMALPAMASPSSIMEEVVSAAVRLCAKIAATVPPAGVALSNYHFMSERFVVRLWGKCRWV